MAKKLITLFIISLVLCGCSIQQKMPRDLPDSDKKAVYTEKITPAIDYVNELAKQKHIAPTLSDDFFDKYMDMKISIGKKSERWQVLLPCKTQ